MGPEGRSVFEEGLYIPIVKCFDAGRPNETFFDFIRAGSRLPVELEGDVYSLCACNDAGAQRLVEMMDEFAMDSLDPLAEFIFDRPRARATLAEIARLPRGTWRAGNLLGRLRGTGPPRRRDDHRRPTAIEVDFAGTSRPVQPRHQRAAGLLPRLCQLRHQVRGGAGGAEQLGQPRAVPHGDSRRAAS